VDDPAVKAWSGLDEGILVGLVADSPRLVEAEGREPMLTEHLRLVLLEPTPGRGDP
jgi:hypothetical protein